MFDDNAEEAKIKHLAGTLPSSNLLRKEIDAGKRGDGIHQTWMDHMRSQGVKRAWMLVAFGIKGPNEEVIKTSSYCSEYDCTNSRIKELGWLKKISDSHLDTELNRVAIQKAKISDWYKNGYRLIPVDLLDDEWIPPVTYTAIQQHLLKIIDGLAPGSDLRKRLQGRDHGLGIRYTWMNQMQQLKVKRVIVKLNIDFSSNGRPKKVGVSRIDYFSEYDAMPIEDRAQLELIHKSGLEQSLVDVASQKVSEGVWFETPQRLLPFRGGTEIEFFDDEWLFSMNNPLFHL